MKQKDQVPFPWSHSARRGQSWDQDQAVWLQRHALPPVAFTDLPGANQPDGHTSWVRVREINTIYRPFRHDHTTQLSGSLIPKRSGEGALLARNHFSQIPAACLTPSWSPKLSPPLPRTQDIQTHTQTLNLSAFPDSFPTFSSYLPTQLPTAV